MHSQKFKNEGKKFSFLYFWQILRAQRSEKDLKTENSKLRF